MIYKQMDAIVVLKCHKEIEVLLGQQYLEKAT